MSDTIRTITVTELQANLEHIFKAVKSNQPAMGIMLRPMTIVGASSVSTTLRDIARQKLAVAYKELHLASLPNVDEADVGVKWRNNLPSVARDGEYGILVLDDYATCSNSNRFKLFQLLENRGVGGYKLPDKWLCIALFDTLDDGNRSVANKCTCIGIKSESTSGGKAMKFLVSAPMQNTLDGKAVVATGSGLNWTASQILMSSLLEDAKRNVRFENVELKVVPAGKNHPEFKDKLVYGNEKATRLWLDTRPYAKNRFISGLVTIVQEIRTESNQVLGYVVVFPDGRVLKVAVADLLAFCENARVQGRNAIQNMQYVSSNGTTAAYLKNYEGRTVPVYIQHRKAVNAEKQTAPVPTVPESVPVPETTKPSASSVFTAEQLEVLGKGKNDGVNIKLYANPAFSAKHMDVIRNVLVHKKDATLLLDTKMDAQLVNFYGFDLVNGADIRPYYNKAYTLKQAAQVKLGVIRGLDVVKYASPEIDGDEMEQLRVRMDADMWSGITAE